MRRPRAPPGPRCWGSLAAARRGVFDAEPLYVPGAALPRARRRRGRPGSWPARAACGSRAPSTRAGCWRSSPCCSSCACARAAVGLPAGGSGRPAARSRRRCPPGATARVMRHPRALRAPRAQGAGAAAGRRARPVRPRRAHRRRRRARRGARPAAPGARAQPAHRGRRRGRRDPPRAPDASRPRSTSTACARTARARRPRASSGPRWPAAASSWTAGCAPEGDTRPLVVLDPRGARGRGGPRRGGPRRGVAVRPPRQARRLRAAAAGRPAPVRPRRRPSPGGPRCTCAWPCSGRAPGPRSGGLAARRGPVLLVAARRGARRAARAGAGRRRGAGARRARRAGRPARGARGRRLHGLRPRRAPRPPTAAPAPGDGRRERARLDARSRRAAAGAPARARPHRRRPAPAPAPRGLRPARALRARPVGRARAPRRHRPGLGHGPRAASGPRSSCSALGDVGDRRVRVAAGAALVLALVLVGVREAGVPATLLWPAHWGELRTGVSQGVDGMPSVTVPYRGSDAWIRIVDPGRRHAAGRAGRAAGLLAAAGAAGGVAGRRRRRAERRSTRSRSSRPAPSGRSWAARSSRSCWPCSSGSSACGPSTSAPPGVILALADRRGADRRAAPGRPAPVARLPGARRGPAAARGRHLRLGPPLHAAGLAARRARGPARQGPDLDLLEGRRASASSTGCAGARAARGSSGRTRRRRRGAPGVAADDDRDAAQHGEPRLHHRRLGAAHPGPGAGRACGPTATPS